MPKRTKSYHAWLVKRLADPYEAERYLRVAMGDSPEVFLKALRNVAEARQMTKIAADTGLNRENLYRTLSQEGNPRFDTLNAVLNAIGMQLEISLKRTTPETPNSSGSVEGSAAGDVSTTGPRVTFTNISGFEWPNASNDAASVRTIYAAAEFGRIATSIKAGVGEMEQELQEAAAWRQ